MFRVARFCLLLAVLVAMAGCASPVVREFRLDPSLRVGTGTAPYWPPSPMVPRYMYVGELLGEQNYPVKDPVEPGFWQKAWRVITGTDGEDEHRPIVLQRPQGGATDLDGRIFVSDVSRLAVYAFDPALQTVQVWEWAAESVRFAAPIGVQPDGQGGLYVSDAELAIVAHLDRNGQPVGTIGAEVLERPTGLAVDPYNGDLYVADTNANNIKVFDSGGHLVRLIGQAGDGRGSLNRPTYLAFARNRLYVTDTMNSRVQVFDRDGAVHQVFGERGLYIGNLARPKGVAVDDEGNVYVVESYYDYLLVYNAEGSLLMSIGGSGDQAGQFFLPAGVWVDDHNRVFVADMFNGRVSVFQFLGGS